MSTSDDAPGSEMQALRRERDSLKKLHGQVNARYLEKIGELSLIRRIGDALKDITDFATVCTSIVSIIQQEIDPDNCSLMVVDGDRNELVLRAAKGPYDQAARYFDDDEPSTTFKIGEAIAGMVAQQGASMRVRDVHAEKHFLARSDTMVDIASLVSIPLSMGERVIAVLNLSHNAPDAFDANQERILAIIANSSAAALENTRLYRRLARSRDELARENTTLKHELLEKYTPEHIIGTSGSFQETLQKVKRVAPVDVNVLITGESGTGKELIARTLHYSSPRSEKPFIAVNCAALPDSLLESELFGIEKGVATGVERRAGKFELANGGTLFLDEIGDMDIVTQAKILRVLQEKEVQRLGSSKTVKLDVRVVSATNKNLPEAIAGGAFRDDLFYRLKVVEVCLPPLRERREDIPLLANFFLRQACRKHVLGEKWFSKDALALLTGAHWPGNVRELENVIEQAAILSAGEVIGPDDFSLPSAADTREVQIYIPPGKTDYKAILHEVTEKAEHCLIARALQQTGNNKSEAARALGLSRRTLMYKLEKM